MKKIISNRYFKIIASLFVFGFIFGLLYILFISNSDKEYISNILNDYYTSILLHKPSIKELFNTIFNNILLLSILLISSIILLFYPLIIIINMYLGFKIGFLLSSLIYVFKYKGILYLFISFFPIYLMKLIIILIFLIYNYKYSEVIYKFFKNSSDINIKSTIIRYIKLFLIFIFIIILISVLEVYITPIIINIFI